MQRISCANWPSRAPSRFDGLQHRDTIKINPGEGEYWIRVYWRNSGCPENSWWSLRIASPSNHYYFHVAVCIFVWVSKSIHWGNHLLAIGIGSQSVSRRIDLTCHSLINLHFIVARCHANASQLSIFRDAMMMCLPMRHDLHLCLSPSHRLDSTEINSKSRMWLYPWRRCAGGIV